MPEPCPLTGHHQKVQHFLTRAVSPVSHRQVDNAVLTEEGQRVAIFYTKLHNRLPRPLLAAHDPPAPLALRQALHIINKHVEDYITEASMTA